MAVTLVSTTDTDEQMAETAEYFNLEAYDEAADGGNADLEHFPETEVPPAATDAAPAPTPAPQATTAVESGKTERTTQEPPAAEPERDEQGRYKSNGIQKRMDELTFLRGEEERKRIAAEKRTADLERELAEAKAVKPPEPEKKPEPVKAEATPEPKEEDFENYADFLKAVTKRETAILLERISTLEQKLDATKEETKQEIEAKTTAERESEERKIAFEERFEAAKAALPDLEEVWGTAKGGADVALSPALFIAIQDYADEADVNDIHVLHWLCRHPEEAQKLADATMYMTNAKGEFVGADGKGVNPQYVDRSNRKAVRAVAEIMTEIRSELKSKPPAAAAAAAAAPATAPATQPKRKVTQAPPPIEPPRTTGTPVARKDPSTMSVTELRSYLRTDEGHKWYTDPQGYGMSEADWQQHTH